MSDQTKTNNPLLDTNGLLTADAGEKILDYGSKLACECPKHLFFLLDKVRSFQSYERTCINESAKDREIHEWLLGRATQLDRLLSGTIVELADREGMLEDERITGPARAGRN